MKEKKNMALSTQIFIALVLAIIAGIALTGAPQFATGYIKPFGTIFRRLLYVHDSFRCSYRSLLRKHA